MNKRMIMKYTIATIIVITRFAIKANAQVLNAQPQSHDLDKLRTDTSLVSAFLKRNPDMFKALPAPTITANKTLIAVYSADRMLVAKLSSNDKMPVAKLSSNDKMMIKKLQMADPLLKANP